MPTRFPSAIAFLFLLLCQFTIASDYQTGLEAYSRGDFEAALREWTPLAEQGDVHHNFGSQ